MFLRLFTLLIFIFAFASSSHARQYGKVLSVHSGDADTNGNETEECHAKVSIEPNNKISDWLKVKAKGDSLAQPTGCSILLAAQVADKRIGFDLVENKFQNICIADKIDC